MAKMRIIGVGIFWAIATLGFAQSTGPFGYYQEAARFSQWLPAGTARVTGMGGAGAATGADLSSAVLNPAGLGLMRKTTFTFSPAISFSRANTEFRGQTTPDNSVKVHLQQFGGAYAQATESFLPTKWKGFTVAGSYTRVMDFNQSFSYAGSNPNSNMANYLVGITDGYNSNNFINQGSGNISDLSGLAYWTYVIRPVSSSQPDVYQTLTPINTVQQSGVYSISGGISRWDAAGAVNYDNKLYMGLTFSLNSLRYKVTDVFNESVDNYTSLKEMQLTNTLTTTGQGASVQMGLIYRASERVRLGASFVSPVFYSIKEQYKSAMTAYFDNYPVSGAILNTESKETVPGEYKYKLQTPSRMRVGGAVVGGKGLLALDVEYVNYGRAFLRDNDGGTQLLADNTEIEKRLKPALNLYMGGEYAPDGSLRLRAGYSLLPSPYKDAEGYTTHVISLGGGLRTDDYYVDISWSYNASKLSYQPYNDGGPFSPRAESRLFRSLFQVTVGANL